ncbi:MAG: carotenoid 1,2-hydratase [Nitrospinae bacterium]|nr:carotenoid 1,2-hydratase [Nitrospinota bacterium]
MVRIFPPVALKILLSVASFLFFPGLALADASAPSPFRQALPGYAYSFPRDFGSHDDFRVEWWYYTGNLEEMDGSRAFGYQLTFFRVALEGAEKAVNPSRWKADPIYFAHLALSDLGGGSFHFFERINRKGLGLAGAEPDRLRVWNEDWTLDARGDKHVLKAREAGYGLDLELTPLKQPAFHGEDGVSRKGREPGNASHYFSFTRMQTQGTILIDGKEHKIRGTSWMDREFSSSEMDARQVGWDWFSIKLNDGREVMLYQLRLKDGGTEPFSSGSLVLEDGSVRHLALEDFTIVPTGRWTSKHTGTEYPSGWELSLKNPKVRLTVEPDLKDQELYNLRSISGTYWEGSVSVTGEYDGSPVAGKGYVELVGYGKALQPVLPE